jgi:hypothetical protein
MSQRLRVARLMRRESTRRQSRMAAWTSSRGREDATAHVALLAGELAQDGDWDGYMISVADAYGRIVAEIPVRK